MATFFLCCSSSQVNTEFEISTTDLNDGNSATYFNLISLAIVTPSSLYGWHVNTSQLFF